MIGQTQMILGGVILIIVMAISAYILTLKKDISNLTHERDGLNVAIANYRLENVNLKNSIEKQNNAIKELKASREKALMQIAEWHKQAPEIKYKVIEKIREVKSNECYELKDISDAIRNINYNDL